MTAGGAAAGRTGRRQRYATRGGAGAGGPWPGAGAGGGLVACVALVVLVAAAAALGGCAGEAPGGGRAADGRLRVVATTGMIADAVARVGGEHVAVTGLMGPGVDPHLYKARAGDVRRLAGAGLILYNGLHLEAAMGEVLAEMGGRVRTVAVTGAIPRERLLAPPEFEGAYDPHVWFDVGLWQIVVTAVAHALAAADPAHAASYRGNAAAFLRELEALDAWVRERVAVLPAERRVLVTAHDAFNYFGRAYGFEVRGLQGISTTAEPGTADVQRLAAEIAARRVPAIFVETSIPVRTLEAVRAAVAARGFRVEIGGELFSDALGDAGAPEGTYIGMVRHNVNTIVNALARGGG
jgi:manganese/zinc/iron transport system substrate-binding protein